MFIDYKATGELVAAFKVRNAVDVASTIEGKTVILDHQPATFIVLIRLEGDTLSSTHYCVAAYQNGSRERFNGSYCVKFETALKFYNKRVKDFLKV